MNQVGQFLRFCCVGIGASIAHLGVVMLLVPIGLGPLVANTAGFVIAFHVSYFGHHVWTFQYRGRGQEYGRMWIVSLMAFGLNQVLYAGMLKWTRLDYRMGLGVVLILIAIMTYVVARSWVFICKRTGEDSETATH